MKSEGTKVEEDRNSLTFKENHASLGGLSPELAIDIITGINDVGICREQTRE